MEEKNEKLALLISVVLILLMLAVVVIARLIAPPDNSIAVSVVAISHNLLTVLIIAVVMYWCLGKPLLKRQLSEQKLIEFNENSEKIFEKLTVLSENIEQLMSANSSIMWEEHSNVLEKLRGYWIQYIPARKVDSLDINTDCRFTLARFDIDQFGKHVYEGTNYFSSGKPNYSFSSIKLLPPMNADNHTKVFYYIYRRHGNEQYENKHGFGKIYAEREADSDPTAYEFNRGFFFNEASKATSHQMYIRNADTVKNILGLHWDFEDATEKQLGELFQKLIDKNIADNWIEEYQ